MEIASAPLAMGRPLLAPPGVSPDLVAILRRRYRRLCGPCLPGGLRETVDCMRHRTLRPEAGGSPGQNPMTRLTRRDNGWWRSTMPQLVRIPNSAVPRCRDRDDWEDPRPRCLSFMLATPVGAEFVSDFYKLKNRSLSLSDTAPAAVTMCTGGSSPATSESTFRAIRR